MSDDPASRSEEFDSVSARFVGSRNRHPGDSFDLVTDGGELRDGSGDDVDGLATRVDELDDAIETLGDEVDELIRDVRERVIQVKREADGKAPSDHDHATISTELDRVGERLDALSDELDERVDDVEDNVDQGFTNFEAVLQYLIETTDDASETLETIARATLDLRMRIERLTQAEARRAAADALRETANENGIAEAKCENCGSAIDLRLLASPDCPYCEERFVELVPRRGFFRSSVLRTGERPALEGEVAREPADLASIVDDDGGSTPPPWRGTDGRLATDPARHDRTIPGGDEESVDDSGAERAAPSRDGAAGLAIDRVSGVGPTYAERLRAAGVHTVGDLALADPDRLAREADIEPGRVESLASRARELAESE